jgi:hypothetical protein
VPKGERSLARGHRGQTKAFLKSLRDGDLISCELSAVRTNAAGRYLFVPKTVVPGVYKDEKGKLRGGGPERDFELRGLTRKELQEVIEQEQRIGVIFSPHPSRDQQRLLSETETTGGY